MTEELSSYAKAVIRHLRAAEKDRAPYSDSENMTLLFLTNGAEQYGVTKEMMSYMKAHPNAGLEELDEYFLSITPPLEVVDDEELSEEER